MCLVSLFCSTRPTGFSSHPLPLPPSVTSARLWWWVWSDKAAPVTVRSEEGTHGVILTVLVSKCFSYLSAIAKYRGWVASQHSHTFLVGWKSQIRVAVWPSSGEPFFQAADCCLLAVSSPGGGAKELCAVFSIRALIPFMGAPLPRPLKDPISKYHHMRIRISRYHLWRNASIQSELSFSLNWRSMTVSWSLY